MVLALSEGNTLLETPRRTGPWARPAPGKGPRCILEIKGDGEVI